VIAVFDGHNDALTSDGAARLGSGRDEGHLDLPRMRAGGMRGGIFAVFSHGPGFAVMDEPLPRDDGVIEYEYAPPLGVEVAAAHATAAAGRLLALEREGLVRVARDIADVDAARMDLEGVPVAVLHLEGAEAIGPGLEALDLWYAAGLRSLGPVWSRVNAFGSGVPFVSPSSPDTGPGLTAAGRRLVARCASLGVMVDLAHLNEAGFWDVARLELGPLVASHTAAHALCRSARNLTDAQIDAVGASDGLVGVIFAPNFLRADFAEDTGTPVSLIAEHVRYVADRIGVSHVGLGSDFDGATICAEVGDAAGIPRVLDALASAGFSGEEVEAIAWGNWRRVLAAWWR
jgi:membrane dipeptidase